MDAVHLVMPSSRYADQYYEVRSEYAASGEEPTFGFDFPQRDFGQVLKAVENWAEGADLPPGEGRRRVMWLIRDVDDKLLATVNIRFLDTEYFAEFGGNIGYGVRPSERGKGYATRLLSLVLDECRKSGMEKVLVTCHPDNVSSARVIVRNGGVPEREVVDQSGERYLRFWIDLRGRS